MTVIGTRFLTTTRFVIGQQPIFFALLKIVLINSFVLQCELDNELEFEKYLSLLAVHLLSMQ